MRHLMFCAAALMLALFPWRLNAQADTVAARMLAQGVAYRHVIEKAGPFDMHVVRIDLRHAELRAARAFDSLRGRERVSDISRRAASNGVRVLAAVNGDFFELQTGENENNQVIDGEWLKGVKNTDSPYDTWDNPHVQFGLDAMNRPYMERFLFDGRAIAHGTSTPIVTLNAPSPGRIEGTALFTSRYGALTPRDTSRASIEAPLALVGRLGDTLVFQRRGALVRASGSPIPRGGAVLAAYGAGLRAAEVAAMSDGDTIRVVLGVRPSTAAILRTLLGGWPRILMNGEDVTAFAPSTEGTISRNAEMKHPRTALGFSRDSSTLILLTVDGRSENSGGMTLTELAAHMRALGAWDALNFDGGGSTTMVVDGALVNKPSDATGERAVGNALLVIARP